MLNRWKTEVINHLPSLFENENSKLHKQAKSHEAQLEELCKQIGKLTTEFEWLKKIWKMNLTPQGVWP